MIDALSEAYANGWCDARTTHGRVQAKILRHVRQCQKRAEALRRRGRLTDGAIEALLGRMDVYDGMDVQACDRMLRCREQMLRRKGLVPREASCRSH